MSSWDEDSCKLGESEDRMGVHLRVYEEKTSYSKPLGLSLKIVASTYSIGVMYTLLLRRSRHRVF